MSKVLQTSVRIHDLCTELVVQPFADRILVLITQVGKVGCLVRSSLSRQTDANWCADPSVHAVDNKSACP